MSASDQVHGQVGPEGRSWVVPIYATADDSAPLGSGVVIDSGRVLTCAHVVRSDAVRDEIWVAFPMAKPPSRGRYRARTVPADPGQDVALVELADPLPPGVVPARLRCPPSGALEGKKWWAFGFPRDHPHGSASGGDIETALTDGWVRLAATSAYHIQAGFSGTAVWSPDFEGVVGMIVEHSEGNALAITIDKVAECLPDHGIREARRTVVRHRFRRVRPHRVGLATAGTRRQHRQWFRLPLPGPDGRAARHHDLARPRGD